MSVNMPWMTSAHHLPEDFNPYIALGILRYILLILETLDQQLCRAFHQ